MELRYTDLFAQRADSAQGRVSAMVDSASFSDPLRDVAVLRNVTIQRSAEGLKEIDRLYKAQRYQEAWDLAYRLEGDLRRVAALTGEAQMTKDADMMRTYQATLSKWLESQGGRQPVQPEVTEPSRLYRGATPTPATIEIR